MPKKVIDLFAGVGGLSLGAARAGFDVALAVETDAHAMAAHQRNFPGSDHWSEDIGRMSGAALLERACLRTGELDGLIGGPPCQGFSVIGQHRPADPRNELFHKFFELVSQCQPKFFVAENVPGILSDKHAAVREAALAQVADGYETLDPIVIKASDFGAATIRQRVFFIGFRPDAMNPVTEAAVEGAKVALHTNVASALHGLPADVDENWLTEAQSWRPVGDGLPDDMAEHLHRNVPRNVGDPESLRRLQDGRIVSGCFGTRHTPEVQARYNALQPGSKDEVSKSIKLRLDGLCPTLRAGTDATRGSYQAVRPIHPTIPRVITPREAARLQGFPDWFRFAPSKWHSFRQIGNSVSPVVAKAVMSVIEESL